MDYTIKKNDQFGSFEVFFNGKPEETTRNALKALKFRWHKVKKCWYGFATEEQIKNAINEETAPISFETVEAGTIYEGWKGNRTSEWRTVEDLKKLLQVEFKKAGLKVSIRQQRAGYLTSLFFTISLPASSVRSFESWREEHEQKAFRSGWLYYTDEDGKIKDIFSEKFYSLPNCEETEALRENIVKTCYELNIKHLSSNSCGLPSLDCLTEEARNKVLTVQEIVSSFNHDQTNSMIDYFDRDIYDDYGIKLI